MLFPNAWGLDNEGAAPFFQVCHDPASLAAIATFATTAGSAIASAAPTIGTIAGIAGTGLGAAGTIAAGRAEAASARRQGEVQQRVAELTAQQLEDKGKDELAQAQRQAAQYRRQKNLALSTLTARSSAGGFTASDPTALAIADEITRYGTLQEQMAMYGGKAKQADAVNQAAMERISGQAAYDAGVASAKAAKKGAYFSAGSTILGGISTLADRYGRRSTTSGSSYRYG
jgi:hypothetical protein